MTKLSNALKSLKPAGPAALVLLTAALCLSCTKAATAQVDPPNRVARVAYAQGNVSLEPAGTDAFGAVELNYPLSVGDRVYADLDAVTELQTSGLAARLGNGADLTITTLNDSVAQFALAQGSVRLATRNLDLVSLPDGSVVTPDVEIDTPNTTVQVRQTGQIRVDFYPQDSSTVVTVNYGSVEISGPGFDQMVEQRQSLRISGLGEVSLDYVEILPADTLDDFNTSREEQRQNSIAYREHYVDPEMIGAGDLDQYGDWQPSPQFGPVWFPRNVGYGWTPYSVGHWANVAPWGYTWVDTEPWGFAPFHYGRWNNFGGRWGWVPGPPPSVFRGPGWNGPPPRPVYSPALVAFVGGGGFSLSLSIGGGGGGGVTAWFPLGPSEPYVPWYHTSPAYVNRVNVTNVYNTNVTEVHNTYINRTTTVYNVTNVTYVNRTTATVAVNQNDFASGRSVSQSAVRLDPRGEGAAYAGSGAAARGCASAEVGGAPAAGSGASCPGQRDAAGGADQAGLPASGGSAGGGSAEGSHGTCASGEGGAPGTETSGGDRSGETELAGSGCGQSARDDEPARDAGDTLSRTGGPFDAAVRRASSPRARGACSPPRARGACRSSCAGTGRDADGTRSSRDAGPSDGGGTGPAC